MLEELIRRATSGKKLDRHVLFRPSLVYQVLRDPFWIWCEYHAPRSEAMDETDRYDEMRWQRGIEYEQTSAVQRVTRSVYVCEGKQSDA